MNKKTKGLLLSGGLTVISGMISRIYYEFHHFKNEYYEIHSPKLPKSFDGMRLVMLADLHNYDYDHGNKKLLKAIEDFSPDAVLIAGDMILAEPGEDMKNAIRLMRDLSNRWPVYFTNGNHEKKIEVFQDYYQNMYQRWQRMLNRPNFHQLNNHHITLERNGEKLHIYGLDLELEYYKRLRLKKMSASYITEKLGHRPKDEYTILIAHNPAYFDDYARWGADLVVSGHVHGGMVILPCLGGVVSPQIRLFPKYYAGLYKRGKSQMILSRGLRMHDIPIRLFNMPEVSCITLHR